MPWVLSKVGSVVAMRNCTLLLVNPTVFEVEIDLFKKEKNFQLWVGLPENANSGKTKRSKFFVFALLRTESARFMLLSTLPTCEANCLPVNRRNMETAMLMYLKACNYNCCKLCLEFPWRSET